MTYTQFLREVGKFLTGLVTADLLMGLWLLAAGTLPQTVFGVWITTQLAWFWVGFDALIILILVHYSWNPKLFEPHASSRLLFFVVGIIMGAVAILHFLRLVFGWPIMIDTWMAPMWISWVGVIVAACLSYMSFHFAAKQGKRG